MKPSEEKAIVNILKKHFLDKGASLDTACGVASSMLVDIQKEVRKIEKQK